LTRENNCDRVICDSSSLESEGLGHKFVVQHSGQQLNTFVLRFRGNVYGYLNQCPHLFLELDYEEGEFFDISGDYIICANHGALFEPESGKCVSGPCYESSLEPIPVIESDSVVMLDDDTYTLVQK